jgi:type II secretory pathway pseudopilin PulG
MNAPGGRRLRALAGGEQGFALVEILIAAMLMVIIVTGGFLLLDVGLHASAETRARDGATNLARQILEDARTIPYGQIAPTSIVGQLQAMNGLADASTETGWQIVRRGVTYTVTASECSINDPKSPAGTHEGTYCNDPGELHENEDLKRVTVDVKWTALGRSPVVHQVATLSVAGEAIGLSASALQLKEPVVGAPSTPTAPVISDAATSQLVFEVTAPTGTSAMNWSLNGSSQTPAPALSSGTTWTFTWPITGLSDGTYQVATQAINATGVYGPPVSISVTLIRGAPTLVKGLTGGFNTVNVSGKAAGVAELQWQANSERNVIGYRVYNPSAQLVCPSSPSTLSLAVSCIDFNPPATSSSNLTYTAVALYRDVNGVVQQGPAGSLTLTGGATPPPGPKAPTVLNLTKNADGSVTLNWTAPASGPTVTFYRIYRGSTDYTSRYDVTATGTTTTYTDTDAVGAHSYWVTAVNANLTESPFLGPVTG